MKLRGFTFSTQNTYGSIFDKFIWLCYNNNIEPSSATDDFIIDFILSTNSIDSIRQRHGVIRNFFDWMLNDKNRLKFIPYPNKIQRIPNYFTLYELDLLINAIENKKQKAIIYLQYHCGLRVSEVVKIKRTDFIKKYDIRGKEFVFDLRIIGKGNKERMIPVPSCAISIVKEYNDSLNPKEKHPEYLFAGQFSEYYSARSVQEVIKRALIKIGYKKKASTHTLRHSKATHLKHAGADIQDIADLLGHSSIDTAKIYSHSDTSLLRISFTKAENFMREELLAQKNELKLIQKG